MKKKLLALTLSALLCSCAFAIPAQAAGVKHQSNRMISVINQMQDNHRWQLVSTSTVEEPQYRHMSDGRVQTRNVILSVKLYKCIDCGAEKQETEVLSYTPWVYVTPD